MVAKYIHNQYCTVYYEQVSSELKSKSVGEKFKIVHESNSGFHIHFVYLNNLVSWQ